jgi:hypothetical protein
VSPRLFTLEEARTALAEVRPLVERLVESRADQLAASARLAELRSVVAGNGHSGEREQAAEAARSLAEANGRVQGALAALAELGVVVKSMDAGLVDFFSLRDGEQIFLCWQLGESDIGFWHALNAGFAGRQPL